MRTKTHVPLGTSSPALAWLRAAPALALAIALVTNAFAWYSDRFLPHVACEPLLLLLPLLAVPFLPIGGAPAWSARTRVWLALALALLAWNTCVDLLRAEAAVAWPRLAAHALAVLGAGMVLSSSLRPQALIAAAGAAASLALAVAAAGGLATYVAHPFGMQAMGASEPVGRMFGNLIWLVTLAGPALLAWLALTWPEASTPRLRGLNQALAGATAAAVLVVLFQRGSNSEEHAAWEAWAAIAAHALVAVLALRILFTARPTGGRAEWLPMVQGAGILALLALSLNTGRRGLALLVLAMLALPLLDRLRAARPRLAGLLVVGALAVGLAAALIVLLGEGPGRHRERLQIARAGIASAETSLLGQGDCAALRLHERDPDLGRHLAALAKTINHLHNEWLECWLATGPLGLALLGATTVALALAAWGIADPRLRRAALLLAVGGGIAAATENSFAGALGCTWLGMACGLVLRAADAAGTGIAAPRLDLGLRLLLLPPAAYCAAMSLPAADVAILGRSASLEAMVERIPRFSDPYGVTALGAAILGQPGVDAETTERVLSAVTRALGPIPWGTGPFDLRLAQAPVSAQPAIAIAALEIYPYEMRFYQRLAARPADRAWPEIVRRRLALLAGAPPAPAELARPETVDQAATLVCAVRGAMDRGNEWPTIAAALAGLGARYADPHLTLLGWEALLRAPDASVAPLRDQLLGTPLARVRPLEAVAFLGQQARSARGSRLFPLLAQAYPIYWRAATPGTSAGAVRGVAADEPGAMELIAALSGMRSRAGR